MRYVDRSTVSSPASITGKDCAGLKESAAAKAHYEADPPPSAAYPFNAYKADDIKKTLHELFHGKCAYCEIRYEGSQPVDIEHYRPKGGVQEKKGHSGYWWLAATWTNLLPACIDCNRRRGQISVSPGMTLAELEAAYKETRDLEPGGKQNAFPTLDDVWAEFGQDSDLIERPSLIDPTRTDPANHLYWPEAEVPVVLPQVDVQGTECPRASASIHIYALNRIGLVQSRLEVRDALDAHIDTIRDMARLAMMLRGKHRKDQIEAVQNAILRLRVQADSKHSFSAMLGARIAEFEAELVAKLAAG